MWWAGHPEQVATRKNPNARVLLIWESWNCWASLGSFNLLLPSVPGTAYFKGINQPPLPGGTVRWNILTVKKRSSFEDCLAEHLCVLFLWAKLFSIPPHSRFSLWKWHTAPLGIMTESLSVATHLHIHSGWAFKFNMKWNLQPNLLPYDKNRTGFYLPGNNWTVKVGVTYWNGAESLAGRDCKIRQEI